uniref:Archaemetzincin-2 n=1 Tax=Jaculus jaculus TaxID=51337 RepID=A0A8C5LDE9_JACJA
MTDTMQVVQHSEHTLKTALISKNPVLVSQYEKLTVGEQRLMNEAFQPTSELFRPITVYSQSDWITSHPEAPQDFEKFFSDPYRKAPTPEKNNIYIHLPSHGSLGNSRVISEEYVKWLKGYCEAFFYGLTVKFLEPVSISATKCSFRKKKPEDAFCVVGITMIDLYPRDSWNFVFGQASLTEGVGIFSFARYGKDFHSSCYKGTVTKAQRTSSSEYPIFDNYYIPEITSVLLLRSCKTLTREIGHIFGLRHSDRRPLNLCPICLRKLQCALGFDIVERYKCSEPRKDMPLQLP